MPFSSTLCAYIHHLLFGSCIAILTGRVYHGVSLRIKSYYGLIWILIFFTHVRFYSSSYYIFFPLVTRKQPQNNLIMMLNAKMLHCFSLWRRMRMIRERISGFKWENWLQSLFLFSCVNCLTFAEHDKKRQLSSLSSPIKK